MSLLGYNQNYPPNLTNTQQSLFSNIFTDTITVFDKLYFKPITETAIGNLAFNLDVDPVTDNLYITSPQFSSIIFQIGTDATHVSPIFQVNQNSLQFNVGAAYETVSYTELFALDGVTSNIQSQIAGLQAEVETIAVANGISFYLNNSTTTAPDTAAQLLLTPYSTSTQTSLTYTYPNGSNNAAVLIGQFLSPDVSSYATILDGIWEVNLYTQVNQTSIVMYWFPMLYTQVVGTLGNVSTLIYDGSNNLTGASFSPLVDLTSCLFYVPQVALPAGTKLRVDIYCRQRTGVTNGHTFTILMNQHAFSSVFSTISGSEYYASQAANSASSAANSASLALTYKTAAAASAVDASGSAALALTYQTNAYNYSGAAYNYSNNAYTSAQNAQNSANAAAQSASNAAASDSSVDAKIATAVAASDVALSAAIAVVAGDLTAYEVTNDAALAVITGDIATLNTDLAAAEADIVLLQDKTQNQTGIPDSTTFVGAVSADLIYADGINVTSIVNENLIEGTLTTINSTTGTNIYSTTKTVVLAPEIVIGNPTIAPPVNVNLGSVFDLVYVNGFLFQSYFTGQW